MAEASATDVKPMKVGVSAIFQYSFFSSGGNTTSFSIANAIRTAGHIPILVNVNGKQEWFEDCHEVKNIFERRHLAEWTEKKYEKLDMFIDIDGYLNPNERRRIAEKVCIFIRKPPFIHECEGSVYPIQQPVRSFECDAIWTWDHFGDQDAHILELLSQKPVYRLPFTWYEAAVDRFGADAPSWLEISKTALKDQPWIPHITETNNTMISNCTIPIVTLSYMKQSGGERAALVSDCYIHNAQQVENHAFFKDNILAHCKHDGLTYAFVGRQRITDWRMQPKSMILSHIRFSVVKGYILDAAWNGIPVVHNSIFLRDIGLGLERHYYSDNSMKGAAVAFERLDADWRNGEGIFAPGRLAEIRQKLKEVLNPVAAKEDWLAALTLRPIQKRAPAPPSTIEIKAVLSPAPATLVPPKKSRTELRIGFSDLWQDANHEYNFWTLLLQNACDHMKPSVKVVGVKITDQNLNEPIDLLFFAPFGNTWKRVPASVPKIHITGENTAPVEGADVFLNLGFVATDAAKGIYRFPLWIQYIDWFGADQDRLINPRSMPIESVVGADKAVLDTKSNFCAFVVSNPSNPVRNEAFNWLSQYKHVDSAGRLFNNVGGEIFTQTAGGGGGELLKMEFLKKYKFCLTYENSRADGYITEKFLAAKAAGCVPIYWGARDVTKDFAPGSFLDANDFTSPGELIEAVRRIDEDPAEWMRLASTPCIQLEKERTRLAEVARLILAPVFSREELHRIPALLGNTKSAPIQSNLVFESPATVLDAPSDELDWNSKTMLVTFATEKYLDSLKQWLESVLPRMQADKMISARVYFGDDVSTYIYNVFRIEYREIEFKRVPSKTVTASGFPDLWEPQHFAWKLWVYQDLVKEAALKNALIWYMDVASVIVRWPAKWFETALNNGGLCMLEDPEQKNEQWCHETFCSALTVTADELAAHQVVGGIMAFVGGAALPWKVFTEAWVHGQRREIIVGPKWAGFRADGKPYGHRHDQSILSILRLRHRVPVEPLYSVYNHESLRRTFKSGASLYIHRGNFKEHNNFTKGIGEVHLINLARRGDRIKQFKENHDAWTKEVCLRPAYDGRHVKLTPALARVFLPNDFHWKKAVMGCALSHLSLWLELAHESSACDNYLILEDDVKFKPGWLQVWQKAVEEVPEDYDVLYLGGVLPPNRGMYEKLLQPVNEFWAQIQTNQIFGQQEPSRYFHFCNYAYILSRKGAKKILEGLAKRGGYYTSADHMICNRVEDMKHYMLTPLVAGCYQDDDPKYAQSEFNNFSRVDQFDSDLWNNDERFTQEEIGKALSGWDSTSNEIPVQKALIDARPATLPPTNVANPVRFFTVGDHKIVPEALMEYKWLRSLFGEKFTTIQQLDVNHDPITTKPVFIFMKPHMNDYITVFQRYEASNMDFYVIHLSDEHITHSPDPIHWYSLNTCKGVVRIYNRKDTVGMNHVLTIPLGPRHMSDESNDLEKRSNVWSFFGTKWMNREQHLEPWKCIPGNHNCMLFDAWADVKQLGTKEYTKECLNSIFIPCPGGQNQETFRFYEALEHGAIPIVVRQDELFFKMLSDHIPTLSVDNWSSAAEFVKTLLQNKAALIQYRTTVLNKWAEWKQELKGLCAKTLAL
jgi:GR25 family glycosyltransferase involved in LPS biosynthesis